MKKTTIVLFVSLLLVLVLPVSAWANISRVVDQALLLTTEQAAALEEKAADVQSTYETEILILTVNTLNGVSAEEYADAYYVSAGFPDNGVLLLLAMAEREWYIYTSGSAIYAFSDRDIQALGGSLADHLGSGNYYQAFDAYLAELPGYLRQVDASTDGSLSGTEPSLPLSILIGAIAAAVVVLIMVSSMNTKRKQAGASGYMHDGSFRLNICQDLFLYSKVDKVRKQETTSSDGKTTVHRSSGGRSHGGGGGKF